MLRNVEPKLPLVSMKAYLENLRLAPRILYPPSPLEDREPNKTSLLRRFTTRTQEGAWYIRALCSASIFRWSRLTTKRSTWRASMRVPLTQGVALNSKDV